jgi:hypothetical protein
LLALSVEGASGKSFNRRSATHCLCRFHPWVETHGYLHSIAPRFNFPDPLVKTNLSLLCATTLLAVLLCPPFLATAQAGETNAPVIVICATVGYPPPLRPGETMDYSPRIVAALWDDGRIVWSESGIQGGPPLQQGRFAREQLNALLGSLEAQGAFTNAALRRPWFGPDSKTTRIVINDGRRRLRMESWHELFETSTNLVVTAQGVTSLDGRNRDAVHREQPAEYRHFIKTWSEVRDAVTDLIPQKGEPYEGKVPLPKD